MAALVDAAVTVLAERLECSLGEARQRLRGLADRSGVSEGEVASAVLDNARGTPAPFDEVRRMASAAAADAAAMAAQALAAPDTEPLADLASTLQDELARAVGADAVAVYAVEPDASLQL